MNKRCCFAGHSEIHNTEELYLRLLSLIEKLIVEENVSEFWVGNYGKFDGISGKAVRELKKKYPSIVLNLVIPYITSAINEYSQLYYDKYDDIIVADFPDKTPKKVQIIKCNEYMVKNSDFIICFVKYSWGGAAGTMEYAKRKKHIKIFNLDKQ